MLSWLTSSYPQHIVLSGRPAMPTAEANAIVDGKRQFSETNPARWP